MPRVRKIVLSVKNNVKYVLSKSVFYEVDDAASDIDKVASETMLEIFDNVDDPVFCVTRDLDRSVKSEIKSEIDEFNFGAKK